MRYSTVVLAIVLACSTIDRNLLGVLLESIKSDLDLSDSQLGLMTGIAFALFYATMGIPIARWADRGDRVTIISGAMALWSAAVALSGMATGFLTLLSTRILAAVGEAGCLPAIMSLVADCFDRKDRARAMAVILLGAPLSMIVGFWIGGWLGEAFGWRRTFITFGAPGVILALLVRLTLEDPRKDGLSPLTRGEGREAPSLRTVFHTLRWQRTFLHLTAAYAISSFFSFGIGVWQGAFYIRTYGMKVGEIGIWAAAIYGFGAGVGVYLGGVLTRRYLVNREQLQLRLQAVFFGLFSIGSVFMFATPNKYVSLGILAVVITILSMAHGPVMAITQGVVPNTMRATALAFLYFIANLIGMGLGPLAVGVNSDWMTAVFGDHSLKYALIVMSPGYLWAAGHYWIAGRTVHAELAAADQAEAAGLQDVGNARPLVSEPVT